MDIERYGDTAVGCKAPGVGSEATKYRVRSLASRVLALIGAVTGCAGSGEPPAVPGEGDAPERRDTTIVHEPCAIDSETAVRGDANGDGRPDVITVEEAGKPLCQWLDLNFDQVADVWVYFAQDGSVRRRETDFDRDGRVDELTTFERGVMVARQRATTLAGRLDTWQHFERGVLTRGERDSNGDGIIDQWWEYPKPGSLCAIVHSDTNEDGRPDPGATVDLCANDDASEAELARQSDTPLFDAPLTESTADVATPAPPAKPPALSPAGGLEDEDTTEEAAE